MLTGGARRFWWKGIRLRSTVVYHVCGLYPIIAGIVGAVFLFIAGMLHLLWNPKSLKHATAWRIKVEQALKHGTHGIVDEWIQRQLPIPVGMQELEVELVSARKEEDKQQKRRKLVIVTFLALGTLLIILDLILR